MQVHMCVAAGELMEDMNTSTHYTKTVGRQQNKRKKEEKGMPKKYVIGGPGSRACK
jgi:uncharacterized membrane-anchored protein YhcB (DUF1043 family)